MTGDESGSGILWWCPECEVERDRGDDAIACDDPADCVRTNQWDGDACGHIVCADCRSVLRDIGGVPL